MNQKKDDLPAMPFYVGDWLKCPEVRALPLDYRALWFDMLCFMWESTERGVLIKSSGEPYTDQEIVRMVGLDNQNSGNWLTNLVNNQVCCRRKDGAIYSKRMVKNEEIRQIRAKSGALGGNPNLIVNSMVKQKVNQNTEYETVTETVTKAVNTTKKGRIVKEGKFKKPTIEEVRDYCIETKSPVDPEYFFNNYESQGWIKANGMPIQNWKLTIKTWEKRDNGNSKKQKVVWNDLKH